ncbi:hypothetical protein DICVIV_07070 [Dictyocaulus viviparus]|uniref:Uncharacterized protein n=1 Tax=Dictyocaulus viviparus TaxID=29172 RepID=A0A0D8XX00_DICVI|nr:hypothetical protein DICVIV_07070 [Dictyocaulus viviparus]
MKNRISGRKSGSGSSLIRQFLAYPSFCHRTISFLYKIKGLYEFREYGNHDVRSASVAGIAKLRKRFELTLPNNPNLSSLHEDNELVLCKLTETRPICQNTRRDCKNSRYARNLRSH